MKVLTDLLENAMNPYNKKVSLCATGPEMLSDFKGKERAGHYVFGEDIKGAMIVVDLSRLKKEKREKFFENFKADLKYIEEKIRETDNSLKPGGLYAIRFSEVDEDLFGIWFPIRNYTKFSECIKSQQPLPEWGSLPLLSDFRKSSEPKKLKKCNYFFQDDIYDLSLLGVKSQDESVKNESKSKRRKLESDGKTKGFADALEGKGYGPKEKYAESPIVDASSSGRTL